MSLSSETLSAIQHAGAAVFAADIELKTAFQKYAQRVNESMLTNPYHQGNDAMFENWKVVARLSQMIAGIEEELKKVYHVASELVADEQPLLVQVSALEAPTDAGDESLNRENDMAPTDVSVKRKKKTTKPGADSTKAVPRLAKFTAAASSRAALGGNAAKLLQHLERVLNANEFTSINQTVIGQETGIPIGSMTAATKKLLEAGRIIAGPAGRFKLAAKK